MMPGKLLPAQTTPGWKGKDALETREVPDDSTMEVEDATAAGRDQG
jgi:hypothetical protein